MYTLTIDTITTTHDTLRDLILFLEEQGLSTKEITTLLKDGSLNGVGKYFQVTKDTD